MTKDYSPILSGPGENDYTRYMRTDALLALQRNPDEMLHRDELLFQSVHQSTEIWLKLASFEIAGAIHAVGDDGDLEAAIDLLARASLAMVQITCQLEMLRHIAPSDFQRFRPALGNGSGFESPGWRSVRDQSERLNAAFIKLVADQNTDLLSLYRGKKSVPLYRLAEALVEWDERVSLWRARHYKVAVRTIGHSSVGTKGTPVDHLGRLLNHKFFPELWKVRTDLTALSANE
jgi:tryptophan 2,3-dioxygenase